MAVTLHAAIFGGSLRAHSLNGDLLVAARDLAMSHFEVERLAIDELPLYNQDEDTGFGAAAEPRAVAAFREGIGRADALVVVSPEYNWGIPGYLKNAIDWVSHPAFDSVLVGKPTLLLGASVGRAGTGRAQSALRQTFLSTRTPVLVDGLQVPFAHERVDGEGNWDPEILARLRKLLSTLAEEAEHALLRGQREKLRKPVPAVAQAPPRTTVRYEPTSGPRA